MTPAKMTLNFRVYRPNNPHESAPNQDGKSNLISGLTKSRASDPVRALTERTTDIGLEGQ